MKQETDNYTVYKHTAPNGKVYIGITRREPQKRYNCGHGYKRNEHFSNAIKKYGWNNIRHEIIKSNLSEKEACKMEIELIKKYKSNQREYGYNIESGGKTSKPSAESIQKFRQSRLGFYHTQETKSKMSASRKNFLENNPDYYSKTNRQALEKAREAAILKLSKKVLQYDMEYNLIFKWNSLSEAARGTNISRSSIFRCCRKIKKSAGGFVWKYFEENSYETRNSCDT